MINFIFLWFKLLLIILTTGIITTFLGYWVHWIFHQPWSAWFYRSHTNHHTIQYPPTNFLSDTYRSAGKDSTVYLFIVAFAPVILGIAVLTFLGIFSLITGACAFVSLIIWGLAHDYFHDQFHLTNTFWKKFKFFLKWRDIHYIHHLDMSKNFGIVLFQWDKLFKTYLEEDVNLNKENDTL